jgi:hypothetical protein
MRPKFQKRSTLKFEGRIIPVAKRSGIKCGSNFPPLGVQVRLDTQLLAAHFIGVFSGKRRKKTFPRAF